MKILLYTDNHFCEKCSILNKYGIKYTLRLENQIESINWLEQFAEQNNCEAIICLGDFFDKQFLTGQEITALNDIKFNKKLKHHFIVGNHESGEIDLRYSSANILGQQGFNVISEPMSIKINNTEICFLPYITERNIQSLSKIFTDINTSADKRIILSHNDIAGIPMGAIISRTGFPITDIENNCDLFINGHLHNGQKISDKIINLGNLTGKDFGENANVYSHNIMLLDTDTLQYKLIENPYAFNFYKITITSKNDLNKLRTVKQKSIISVSCILSLLEEAKNIIDNNTNIIESRIIISHENNDDTEATLDIKELLSGDHLQKLIDCCKNSLGNSDILNFELGEICK